MCSIETHILSYKPRGSGSSCYSAKRKSGTYSHIPSNRLEEIVRGNTGATPTRYNVKPYVYSVLEGSFT